MITAGKWLQKADVAIKFNQSINLFDIFSFTRMLFLSLQRQPTVLNKIIYIKTFKLNFGPHG